MKEGVFPGIQYPKVPGHEIVGVIDATGIDVTLRKKGQRVGVGWFARHCGYCKSCRRADFPTCGYAQTRGISYDRGYSDFMIAPSCALAHIPDELSPQRKLRR